MEAQRAIQELFKRIKDIKEKAEKSEQMVKYFSFKFYFQYSLELYEHWEMSSSKVEKKYPPQKKKNPMRELTIVLWDRAKK